jgi:hypothetical protein
LALVFEKVVFFRSGPLFYNVVSDGSKHIDEILNDKETKGKSYEENIFLSKA